MDIMEAILKQRKLKGISWEELAKDLPINGNSLRMAFNRKSVDKSYLEKICEKLEIQNAQNTLVNTNGNTFEKRSYGYYLEVNLLPFESYATYSETLENVLVAYDFEKVTFNVDQYGLGNYMAFKIKGDSMNGGKINDTMDKALVLGRELGRHHWLDGFNPTDFGWIILSKKNIYHKDIVDLDRNTGDITCHSRNPLEKDFKLNLNDVYQIFKVIKRIQ